MEETETTEGIATTAEPMEGAPNGADAAGSVAKVGVEGAGRTVAGPVLRPGT